MVNGIILYYPRCNMRCTIYLCAIPHGAGRLRRIAGKIAHIISYGLLSQHRCIDRSGIIENLDEGDPEWVYFKRLCDIAT